MQDSAKDAALKRLSIREYSASEMRAYLKKRGFAKTEAEDAVNALVAERMIDDTRYARVIARHQSLRGKGPAYVMAKLRQKGVSIDLRATRAIFDEAAGTDELTLARALIERRYPTASRDARSRARAFAALVRRGFSRETAAKALGGKPGYRADEEET